MTRLVLGGGTLIDGTGSPARPADVVIEGDRIADVVGPGQAGGGEACRLDCHGLSVCPGFIDTHSHSDLRVIAEPALPMKVRQGVTLDVLGQDGISVAPIGWPARLAGSGAGTGEGAAAPADGHQAALVADVRRQLAGLLGDPQLPEELGWVWRTVDDYLNVLGKARAALDLAYLVPHGAVRRLVAGMANRPLDAGELDRACQLLGASLDEGALGMSTGLIYPPCCYAPTLELVALCRQVAKRDKVLVVHMRSESDMILGATDEMIEVARQSGVHLHISHFKIAGRNNADKLEPLLQKIDQAQRSGVAITADQYPYTAGSTMFGAILPPWAHEGGGQRTLERLADPAERARMRREMEEKSDQEWDNFWKWTGPEGIVISDVPSGQRPELVGLTVAEAAARLGRADQAIEVAFDLLLEQRMGIAMISHSQMEPVVARLFQLPYVNGCTDGLLGGKPHPRAYGTYPRALGRYVREQGRVALVEAVRKLTSQAADTFRIPDHGRVQRGARANLVAFDEKEIVDTATFAAPVAYPRGLPHVVVGGQVVVESGQQSAARPGQVVRRA
jgi:N-acyl-D-amino-acid deacylase